MKKLIILGIFLFISQIIFAPTLTSEVEIMTVNRKINKYNKQLYKKELNKFISHLGFKESQNNWKIVNQHNCIGEWQFSESTLKHLGYGYITADSFKTNSSIFPRELQIELLKTHLRLNEESLIKYEKYIGTEINGVLITKSGLLAGAHLGGVGSIKHFIESDGQINNGDAYGTTISDYIKEFGIYDFSGISIETNSNGIVWYNN